MEMVSLLSIGWVRYLFIPLFVGSVYVAVMLSDFTSGFDIRVTVKRAAAAILRLRFGRANVCVIAAVLLPASLVPITVATLYFGCARPDSHKEVASLSMPSEPHLTPIEESELFYR